MPDAAGDETGAPAGELDGGGELADEPDPGPEPEPEPLVLVDEPDPVGSDDGAAQVLVEPEPEPEADVTTSNFDGSCDPASGLVDVGEGQCASLVVLDPATVEVGVFGGVLVLASLGALVVSNLRR
jgi:hypothetical protein